ncbi:MAG: TonB-dependent receptor [Filimonas sp.]|nr:TonB-dependent receptor [Filimonas sp.]
MRKCTQTIFLLLMLLLAVKINAQNGGKITGQVSDATTKLPLASVSVSVKGTQHGTISDDQGKFSLTAKQGDVLVVTSVGYEPMEIKVASANVSIILKSQGNDLTDVVVVGYGKQKKVNLTGAITSVKGEEMNARQTGNAYLALQGLAPGLTIRQLNGQPGDNGAFVRVRGEGSINAGSSPLVLVDGVEMDFNNLDMSTVESISVLKDASSASIYGSRAANGVILVTTKRGVNTDGKARVTLSSYVAIQNPTNMPDPVSAVEYMQLINQANKNNNANPQFSDQLINDYITLGPDNNTRYATDWRGMILKNSAVMQNHSFNMNAGTEKLRTVLSGSFYNQDGLIKNNNYKRYTLRSNTDYSLTKWLRATLDLNFRNGNLLEPSLSTPQSIIRKALSFVPIFSGKNNNGTWGYGQNGDNPIAVTEVGGTTNTKTPEVIVNGGIVITPLKGLTSTTNYTVRTSTTRVSSFISPYDTYEGGVFKATYPPDGTQGSESWTQVVYKLFRSQLNYNTILAHKHEIGLLAGVQTEETRVTGFNAGRKGYYFTGYDNLSNGDPATATNAGSTSELAMASFFGRINYAFAGKYLVELNGRWDASSRFARENWWAFFPSASVGWRVSEENFMKTLKPVLSNLKFRSSYGLLGNQSLSSYYPAVSTIDLGWSYWFNKQLNSGGAQTILANPNIQWEKSRQFNIGVDAGFFQNKLNFSFDYYRKYIYDLLQQLPVPYYVGMSAPFVNAGSMENKGWEASVNYNNKIGKVNYSITANLSDVKNKVLNLYGKQYISSTIIKEGYAINSYYGYKTSGYFQNQDEINKAPAQFNDKANTKPGYIRYQDLNGSGIVNDSDRVVLGNPFPRYEYSLDLKVNYKGFDLDIFLQGVGKRQYYISGYGAQPFYVGSTIFKSQTDTWSPTNSNAAYPLLLIDGSGVNPNYKISDKWIANAAYMRVKLVTLGYTLPKRITDKAKMGPVRFYVSAQNLLTISNFIKGYDVEAEVSSGQFYPLMRTTTFGVNVNF